MPEAEIKQPPAKRFIVVSLVAVVESTVSPITGHVSETGKPYAGGVYTCVGRSPYRLSTTENCSLAAITGALRNRT